MRTGPGARARADAGSGRRRASTTSRFHQVGRDQDGFFRFWRGTAAAARYARPAATGRLRLIETWLPTPSPPARRSPSAVASYEIHRLDALQSRCDVARLPYTLRILLENVLRTGDEADVEAVGDVGRDRGAEPRDLVRAGARPAPGLHRRAGRRRPRRDAQRDGRPRRRPGEDQPADPGRARDRPLVQVDEFATRLAFRRNVELEFERNRERYAFLRWGQTARSATSRSCRRARASSTRSTSSTSRAWSRSATALAFPDTLVGTDSHTTMVNGLGVLGWGVGGIEAEAAMLGEPLSMLVPQVVGFRLTGELPEGATATDLVLTVTEILRQTGVVGKFVEYFGHGLASLPLADRATIGNMSPEYGATCGFFPVDEVTLEYLRLTGRQRRADRARRGVLQGEPALARAGRGADVLAGRRARPRDRRAVARRAAAAAGPRAAGAREDRVPRHARHLRRRLATNGSSDKAVADTFPASDPTTEQAPGGHARAGARRRCRSPIASPGPTSVVQVDGEDFELEHGSVVIAAITSCTNTSNPTGDGRRRPAREEGGRARARAQAVGEVEPRAGLEGRHRVLRQGGPDAVPRGARLPHGRLRLHDLHRQLGPACRSRSRRRSPRATSSSARCSPATATSRRASIPR